MQSVGRAGCNFRLSQTRRKVARTSDLASPNEACNAIKENLITLRHPHAPPTVGAFASLQQVSA